MAEEQGTFQAVFDGTTINLTRVGTASAWTGKTNMDVEGILADVYDPTTNTLRIVEV